MLLVVLVIIITLFVTILPNQIAAQTLDTIVSKTDIHSHINVGIPHP
jgi:hypothetical protein